jgi:hypothetical protein
VTGETSRRELLRAVMAATLLPVFAGSVSASAVAQARSIAPPSVPMLLTRRLMRELTGGYSIFRIRFGAVNGGFRVDGSQVASSVKAPPNLAEFARLEQQRVETGLFPLELDARA